VEVVVTYSQWNASTGTVTTGGYVSGLVESGGTCTVTLSHDDDVLTGTAEAFADAASTACAEVAIPVPAGGDWQVVLSYESATTSGTSAPGQVSTR
jgi:hypothetical protein